MSVAMVLPLLENVYIVLMVTIPWQVFFYILLPEIQKAPWGDSSGWANLDVLKEYFAVHWKMRAGAQQTLFALRV
jgi:hypothetical protein